MMFYYSNGTSCNQRSTSDLLCQNIVIMLTHEKTLYPFRKVQIKFYIEKKY